MQKKLKKQHYLVLKIYKYSSKLKSLIIYKNKNADLEIPKAKNKPINLIIHNNLVYRIGMLLFKKGSKIRNFLKRHL